MPLVTFTGARIKNHCARLKYNHRPHSVRNRTDGWRIKSSRAKKQKTKIKICFFFCFGWGLTNSFKNKNKTAFLYNSKQDPDLHSSEALEKK
jgi:Pyruvate/2-oxoacid:ferredoxin oxidoreductase delta subunit